MASEISESGHLDFSSNSSWHGAHGTATPALNILLSSSSASLGLTPFDFAQVLTAIVFVATAGSIFILARLITGSSQGALAASIAAITLGTYVFSTGSAWKVSLGMTVLALLFLAYARRAQPQFRMLTITILFILPLVHHLAAAIGYLAVVYFLVWSWLYALANSSVSRRHYLDAVSVMPPILFALTYYGVTLTDRIGLVSSPLRATLFLSCFAVLTLLSFVVLSLRSHSRWSYAPVVGAGIAFLFLIDYSGLVFPYTPSASQAYLLLVFSGSCLFGLAWYGAEALIERRPVYRTIMLGMLMSPLTIILYGVSFGFTGLSHQILYRAFDFADFFVFLGLGFTVSIVASAPSRKGLAFVAVAIACLLVSFPFGYYTSDLLGVEHETASYEVDAVQWIAAHTVSTQIVSDERIGRIAHSMTWVEKRSYLPYDLVNNITQLPGMYYCIEDSWTDVGVNNYPYGRAVIPEATYSEVVDRSDVLYIGGPETNRLLVFSPSR